MPLSHKSRYFSQPCPIIVEYLLVLVIITLILFYSTSLLHQQQLAEIEYTFTQPVFKINNNNLANTNGQMEVTVTLIPRVYGIWYKISHPAVLVYRNKSKETFLDPTLLLQVNSWHHLQFFLNTTEKIVPEHWSFFQSTDTYKLTKLIFHSDHTLKIQQNQTN